MDDVRSYHLFAYILSADIMALWSRWQSLETPGCLPLPGLPGILSSYLGPHKDPMRAFRTYRALDGLIRLLRAL